MYKVKYYTCQNRVRFSLRFNLTAWLIDLDAGLKIFFHFKLKGDHLRLHTSPLAVTSFTGFYKLPAPTARTTGPEPVFLIPGLRVSFKRRESPLAENSEFYS